MLASKHVFVYGTLRKGGANDITHLTPAPRFVGEATLPGRMYHLRQYPGVVLGEPGQVVGEVYAISPELERVLDEIEELYPQKKDEYFKRFQPVRVNNDTLSCIVYEINPAYLKGCTVITSGDWLDATGRQTN
ncbi:MAG: hypothetical protein RLZZ271_1077 [Pseudomonadota bacterium]|jgi:gamma-glutamylcyclotransferase (GGCT)/AIG2-like uncharacterized protein YtfP